MPLLHYSAVTVQYVCTCQHTYHDTPDHVPLLLSISLSTEPVSWLISHLDSPFSPLSCIRPHVTHSLIRRGDALFLPRPYNTIPPQFN